MKLPKEFTPLSFLSAVSSKLIDAATLEADAPHDSELACEIAMDAVFLVQDVAYKLGKQEIEWSGYSSFLEFYPEFYDPFWQAYHQGSWALEVELLKNSAETGTVTVYCPRGCNHSTVMKYSPWDECASCGSLMVA